jgi:hypothetical protein
MYGLKHNNKAEIETMSMKQTTHKNGTILKIGDWIGFKCDIEQAGCIIKIEKGRGFGCGALLTLESKHGFDGEYIGGDLITQIDCNDGWTE